ncbi:MAG: TPM domain-containing protein [Cyclobacteriaceae bacterium]|nr:TPM domain-containing protein [Cyclobacteriaceae bacterium]
MGIKGFSWGVMLFLVCNVYAQEFPDRPVPPRLVNDFAEILSNDEKQLLENKLVAYNDSTSTQIAIVTVSSLRDYPASDYSFQLAEMWGIGQQGTDNGLLILVAPNERRIFIATGYGLEPYVPDVVAKRIIEKTIKPNFRNEDYYRGLDQATNILMGLLSGQFAPEQLDESISIWPLLLLFGFFLLVLFLISRGNRGGGSYYDPDSRTYMGPYRGSSTWSDFSGGRGSFGGGGGGGFGGFGGGSFGGGGAGGSW